MSSSETLLNAFGVMALLVGVTWLLLAMHVLCYSELKHGKFDGGFQFWPFYEIVKKNYPDSSRAGRTLFVVATLLSLPWVVGKIIGVC